MRTAGWVMCALVGCGPAEHRSEAPPTQPPSAASTVAASTPAPPPPAPSAASPGDAGLVASGEIDGKPFAPTMAWVFAIAPDGYANINFMEKEACEMMSDGDIGLGVMIPWKKGASVDLGSEREVSYGKKVGSYPTAALVTNKTTREKDEKSGIMGTRVQNTPVESFKPKGTATLLEAPTAEGAIARLAIDLSSGGYTLKGEVDVKVCFELKPPP